VRIGTLIPLVVIGLLLVAILLPSARDKSVSAWWTRVRYQLDFYARATLALACLAGFVWYVLLPLFGWRPTHP
jgi:hypothetical protein